MQTGRSEGSASLSPGVKTGMEQYQNIINILIIGGGPAGDGATRRIREMDTEGSIRIISMGVDPPYARPSLSKGLWNGRPVEKIWRKAASMQPIWFLDDLPPAVRVRHI